METTTIPDPPGFAELSKEEQIRYLLDLWDRITEEPDEIPVPESHLAIAMERLAEHRRDPSSAKPALEALDSIAKNER
jgi:putative addiction module component (TIGR02574 family)